MKLQWIWVSSEYPIARGALIEPRPNSEVVTNDGREFAIHRIRQFGLTEFVDFFVVSCFVHCRKPEPEIYRLALDLSQTPPARVVYIDDQLLFVEVAQKLGVHGIHHTDYASTRAALETLGLSLTS